MAPVRRPPRLLVGEPHRRLPHVVDDAPALPRPHHHIGREAAHDVRHQPEVCRPGPFQRRTAAAPPPDPSSPMAADSSESRSGSTTMRCGYRPGARSKPSPHASGTTTPSPSRRHTRSGWRRPRTTTGARRRPARGPGRARRGGAPSALRRADRHGLSGSDPARTVRDDVATPHRGGGGVAREGGEGQGPVDARDDPMHPARCTSACGM